MNKKQKNSDYASTESELFTEDHCFATEEGYQGTGDYSIIGSDYVDSGFAPYAVAIHIVYLQDDLALRVAHFVSDSNDGIDDPAGKFREAVRKFRTWLNGHKVECPMTEGVRLLLHAYDTDAYPGLGSLKKFTVMHHMELMSGLLPKLAGNGGLAS